MTMKLPAFVLGGVLLVWMSVNLLPFLLVGETWAMLWMPLNWPLSAWVEAWLGIGSNSYVLILAVTALNGVVYGGIAAGVVWMAARLRRKRWRGEDRKDSRREWTW